MRSLRRQKNNYHNPTLKLHLNASSRPAANLLPRSNESLASLQDLIEQGSQGSVLSLDSLPQSLRDTVALPPVERKREVLFGPEMTLSDYISKNSKALRSPRQKRHLFASSHALRLPPVFKPYSLADYRKIRPQKYETLGGLGPVAIGREDWKEKVQRRQRAQKYADEVRARRQRLVQMSEKAY